MAPSTGRPRGDAWVVAAPDEGTRLDRYLAAAQRLGSRSRAAGALSKGKIFVNDQEASPSDAARRVRAGDVVRHWGDRPGSARRTSTRALPIEIVFEDAALIVVNKPPGLLTVPLARREQAPSVLELLDSHLHQRGGRRPLVVHRIDRDTSGLVLFAKSSRAQAELKAQFRRHEPERIYWAVVYGTPTPAHGTWRDHLVWDAHALIQKETHARDPRAAEAVSAYRVLETFEATSLIEVTLHTGKRNQIRLQARLRGHTLVGEQRYVFGPESLRPIAFDRQALHARCLAFRHPETAREVRFEAALPEDMDRLLRSLRGSASHGAIIESNPRPRRPSRSTR